MRRRMVAVCLLLVVVLGGTTLAAISGMDKKRLQRQAGDYLDPQADDTVRSKAREEFTDYFKKKKVKELADVEALSELLAECGKRSSRHRGIVELTFQGMAEGRKYKTIVSAPKKYDPNGPAWPLIFCVPDREQKAQDYLDKYWSSKAIRDEYIIAALEFDYSDVEVEERETVKEEGEVKTIKKMVKKPFDWTHLRGVEQWWRSLIGLMITEFKVDPNRVILDGAGLGATGNLSIAAGNSWRFAGLILRGGEYDDPTIQNFANLKVLAMPLPTAPEASAKTMEKLKEVAGKHFSAGTNGPEWMGGEDDGSAMLEWLNGAVRVRYPNPVTWTYTRDVHQIGHWVFVESVFKTTEPSRVTVEGDPKQNVIKIQTENVQKFDLFLNDLLVDLDKPFKIVINGAEPREFERTRSADDLLDHASVTGGKAPWDPGCVFTAEVKGLKVEPPPAGEKEDDAEKGGDKEEGNKEGGD